MTALTNGEYTFDEWTPERLAKFAGYRLRGMHPEWAVFWATINRQDSRAKRLHAEEEIEKSSADKKSELMEKWWVKPIKDGREELLPPAKLFKALET